MENLNIIPPNNKNSQKRDSNHFSSNTKDYTNKFQTTNMINKIKKIKKRQNKRNYQNIPEFDILHNNPSNVIQSSINNNDNKQPENKLNKSILQSVKDLVFGKTTEAYTAKPDEYEGHDDYKEPETVELKGNLAFYVEESYKSINEWSTNMAKTIYNISTNTANEVSIDKAAEDIKTIQTINSLFIAAVISIWATYNWYFLMFYANDKELHDIHIPRLSEYVNDIKEKRENNKSGQFKYERVPSYAFIFDFLQYALWFPLIFEKLTLDIIPKYSSWFLNGTLCFLFIYILLFAMNYSMGTFIKDFFIDLLTDASTNKILIFMFIIVFVLFLSSLTDLPDGVIFCIFAIFSRLLLATVISVPLGGIITGLYFIIYSLFGKILYKRTTRDIVLNVLLISGIIIACNTSNTMPIIITTLLLVSLFLIFKPPTDIEEYISGQHAAFENAQFCNANTIANFGYDILRQIMKIVEFIRTYLMRIVFLILVIYSIILLFGMHNSVSQSHLYGVFLFTLLFLIKVSWPLIKSAINYFRNNNQDVPDANIETKSPLHVDNESSAPPDTTYTNSSPEPSAPPDTTYTNSSPEPSAPPDTTYTNSIPEPSAPPAVTPPRAPYIDEIESSVTETPPLVTNV
jgi:hypothetical protein